MDHKLKTCPFCGGTDIHIDRDEGQIICYDCLATFSQQEITCEEDLAEAWNRRAQ